MADESLHSLVRNLHQLAGAEPTSGRTDQELLEAFCAEKDSAPFAALVRRHGAMVLRVCRGVLGHEQDAEDAFQATFLVLAGHAAGIRKRGSLSSWLHGVAHRTALSAKRDAGRRRTHERLADTPRTPDPAREVTRPGRLHDVRVVAIDAEGNRHVLARDQPTCWRTTRSNPERYSPQLAAALHSPLADSPPWSVPPGSVAAVTSYTDGMPDIAPIRSALAQGDPRPLAQVYPVPKVNPVARVTEEAEMAVRWFFLLVFPFVVLPFASAQEKSVRPGINDPFKNPDPKEWVPKFEVESREVYEKRKEIVAACKLKPGQVVADVGAGTGLFTRLFAHEVKKDGIVYAVDIAPKFLDHIAASARKQDLKNIKTVLGTDVSACLPESSVDVVFICDTYHHFEFPQRMMASVHKALKPGGRVVVIDFIRTPGKSSEWVLKHVRAGQDVVEKEIGACGFRKTSEVRAILKENYLVVFEKVTPPAKGEK